GYGFPENSLWNGVKQEPDIIGVDAGSTDPGPYYLGSGKTLVPDSSILRDLKLLLKAQRKLEVPLVIGSAGGSGSRVHVNRTFSILKKAIGDVGGRFRVKLLYSDIDQDFLERVVEEGRYIVDLGFDHSYIDTIKDPGVVVAQNGIESIIKALKDDADIILAGRVVDISSFAALPWMRGFDKGLAVHMAKILECGAIAAEPGSGADGLLGILRRDEFEVRALNPDRKTTVISVAEHALYERNDPYRETIPGGYADFKDATYEQVDLGVVVRGSRWIDAQKYMVKLEGSRPIGHRVVVIAGVRDPLFISELPKLYEEAVNFAVKQLGGGFSVYPRFYGWNGILGSSEARKPSHEVGLVLEVVAADRSKAEAAAGLIRSTLLHIGWPSRKTTAGNLAFPFSPSDLYAGIAYEWSLWHLVELKNPLETTRIKEVDLNG
ncbi:MAG: DUF1446 domain-containing protein, partial [Desulfurococcales archaeon]|nr:DUF1446 domain-containing protein [Desulfurococcales archaeon]